MAGQSVIVRAPWQGIDRVTAPSMIRPDRAVDMQNFLPGRPGKLVLRGPIYQGVAATPQSSFPGFWSWNSAATTQAKLLFLRSDLALQSAIATSAMGLNASFAVPTAGMKLARQHVTYGDNTYGIGTDTAGVPTKLYKWDGTDATIGLTQITNGPGAGLRDVALHLDRIVALGVVLPGGVTVDSRRRLFWTDPSWDGTDTLVKWQDDVSGLTNQLVLGEDAHTLHSFNGALYILGYGGVQVLRGSSPSNWSLRKVSSIGCVGYAGGSRTSVVTDEGIYYRTATGVALFDGAQSVDITADVRTAFTPLVNNAELQVLDAEWLCVQPSFNDTWYAYNRKQHQWTTFASSLLSTTRPMQMGTVGVGGTGTTVPWVADTTKILDVSILGEPDIPSGYLISLINNGVDTTTAPAPVEFSAAAATRMIALASPARKSQVRRVCVDLILQSPSVSTLPTCTIFLLRGDGQNIATKVVTSTTSSSRQRVTFDVFQEVDSIWIQYIVDTNSQIINACEIQDAVVEFTPGQDST